MADDSINALIAGQRNASVIDSLANPPQVNVLGSISRAADAAKSVMGMRALQSQQAWGEALQQATGSDGTVNYPLAQAIAAKRPDAAMGMAAGLESSSGRMNEQVSRGHVMNGWLQGTIGALPDNATRQQIIDTFKRGEASGILPSDIAARSIAEVPTDPAKMPAYIQQMRTSAGSLMDQLKVHYGQTFSDSAGGQIVSGTQSLTTGAKTPAGAPITMTASPGEQLQTITTSVPVDKDGIIPIGPDGKPRRTPSSWQEMKVQAAPVLRVPMPGAPGASGVSTGTAPPTPPAAGTRLKSGAYPPAGASAPAPPAPASPVSGGGAVVSGAPAVAAAPPAGYGEELAASAEHAGAARAKANIFPRDVQPIEGVITALSGADTGKASELLNSIRGTVQDVAPTFLQRMMPASVTDPDRRKAFDEAVKYSTQMQLQAPGGARSDVGSATAGAATPGVHISNAAALELARAALAQRRLEQVGTLLFNKSGKSVGEFDRHVSSWATAVDPMGLVADKMSDKERAIYVQSIGGTTLKDGKPNPAYLRFKQSYQDAVDSGVMQPQH
jgi:hypothetical protein